jgi:cytochrome d ubiquinol oxidase subunit I
MVTAAYLTTAFVAAGVGGYYLARDRHVPHARVMLGMAMIMAIVVAPLQLLMGDLHGLNTLEHQPAKVAAMEGLWETRSGAPLVLFGWPDEEAETTKYAVEIPKLSSLILTHELDGEVKGLKEWPREERPPVASVFWSFRIMVGIGTLMILTGLVGLVLFLNRRLFDTRWFQYWCMALAPAGFIAVLAGWFVTEIGRQPYIVFNVMRTADAVSPLNGEPIAISLAAFVLTYGFIFGAGSYYIVKLIRKGPDTEEELYGSHGVKEPPLVTGMVADEKGGRNV